MSSVVRRVCMHPRKIDTGIYQSTVEPNRSSSSRDSSCAIAVPMPTHIVRTGMAIFHENPNKHRQRGRSLPEKPIQQTACSQRHNAGKQRSTAPYAEASLLPRWCLATTTTADGQDTHSHRFPGIRKWHATLFEGAEHATWRR